MILRSALLFLMGILFLSSINPPASQTEGSSRSCQASSRSRQTGRAKTSWVEMASEPMVLDRIEANLSFLEKVQNSILENSGETSLLRNQFMLQVAEKAKISDETAEIFLRFFLQNKLSTLDPLLEKKLISIHAILVLLYQIKIGVDLNSISQVEEEYQAFKRMLLLQSTLLKPSASKEEMKPKARDCLPLLPKNLKRRGCSRKPLPEKAPDAKSPGCS